MNRTRTTLTILAALVCASWTYLCYLAHFNNYRRDMLSDLVYYRADRPFVKRTLLPTTVNLLTRLVPQHVKNKAVRFVSENSAMRQVFTVDKDPYSAYGALKLERNYPVETCIALILMFGCLLGFLWVTLALYDLCYYPGSLNFRAAVPALAAAGVVPWLSYTSHPYDLVGLFLFAAILLLIQRNSWTAYLIVFTLACINKETAILDTLVLATYFAVQRRLWTRLPMLLIGIQLAVFSAIYLTMSYVFRNNPGPQVEFHLFDINLPMMRQWLRRPYGAQQLVAALIIGIALFFRWREKPLVPRCAMVIAVPLALMWPLLGVLDEWRAYTDLYPPMLLLILGSIGYLFGVQPRSDIELNKESEKFAPETA